MLQKWLPQKWEYRRNFIMESVMCIDNKFMPGGITADFILYMLL